MEVECIPQVLDVTTTTDRRRAGRPAAVSPHLVPLLRGSTALIEETGAPEDLRFGSDQSSPAAGILLGMLISGVMWVGLVAAVRSVL